MFKKILKENYSDFGYYQYKCGCGYKIERTPHDKDPDRWHFCPMCGERTINEYKLETEIKE
mgnify:CR=1 FL=1